MYLLPIDLFIKRRMGRYYFDFRENDHLMFDDIGVELSDLDAAHHAGFRRWMTIASKMPMALASERQLTMEVRDERDVVFSLSAALQSHDRFVGNLAPMPGSVSWLSRPGRSQRRRRTRTDHDALGYATTAPDRRPAGHKYPQHVFAALARMVEAWESMLSAAERFAELPLSQTPPQRKRTLFGSR
jgi:hypothetical protein